MYEKTIEIYRIVNSDFISPLAVAPETQSYRHDLGDFVVIIGNEVWIKHPDNTNDEYSLAVYSPQFVRINNKLFERI